MNPVRLKKDTYDTAFWPGVPTLAPVYITYQSVPARVDTCASRWDSSLKSIHKL